MMNINWEKPVLKFRCSINKEHMWAAQTKMYFCPICGAEMVCENDSITTEDLAVGGRDDA